MDNALGGILAVAVILGSTAAWFTHLFVCFSDDRWGELTNLLEIAGSFDYARQLIHNHIDRALSSLEVLPMNKARELLIELAKQSLRRRT